ncbi:histone-lysine N-methyltransferase SETD7 [Eurytemora carolleeae]|uniref:histone-lysine N-methyltransferase SETD7 n=1 Tax=Eurytemora carolleeae TaxID=1294199 RepID=UPI000C76B6AC|nr:histone-lysine N-methyltransferase SETD7 [Eurytemora carolleeae]XP_023348055.1 histone-lysine N-methyltransferase SETD7 [Eurytemora carolleeae]|eukprot:XP_023348048.1 histone-lysine N-methyltransferase SETD7-like [Eurytemora affinis]
MLGGSWIIRSRENKSVFLYPDLSTALVGDFSSSGSLESEAEVAEVVGISSQGGIITPVLRSLGSRIPVPEPSSSETFLNQPFVKDPFESLHVEVKQSLIPGAGEGLFTTRRIRAGQLISFFAGVKVEVSGELSEESDYTISLENGVMLDIPPSLRSTYCGTLGHKACHSFQPSARYSYADHPRFGRIRSISALHDMEPGEEVTTDYRYSLRKAPDWYRDCLLRYLVEHRELSRMEAEAYINDIANTKENQHSTIEDKIDHISSAVDKTKLIT